MAEAVQKVVARQEVRPDLKLALLLLGFGDATQKPNLGADALTQQGLEFDDAWSIYRDEETATALLRAAYLRLPVTQALMQGLHGRGPVPVDGAHHLLVRHGLAEVGEATRFRQFLQVLNDLGVVAYSRKNQAVRIIAPVPVGQEAQEPKPVIRVIEKDRPYSNVRHLRETLRECREFVSWVDPHFERRGLDLLVDEADSTKISSIQILSGGRPERSDVEAFKLFRSEMASLGIEAEWRVVAKPDVEWHDRYIVTKGKAWNVPPIAAVFKGKHSQITDAPAPPLDRWWASATAVEDL